MKQKLSPVKLAMAKLDRHKRELSRPGVFILYNTNMGPPHYVGRDDVSMYLGLTEFNTHPHYKYYKFLPCKTAENAYQWECIYWHTGHKTLDNSESNGGRHPKRPANSSKKCPVPGCKHDEEPEIPVVEAFPEGGDFSSETE